MPPEVGPLIDDLREIIGDALRVVATYEAEDYEIHYVRPDVRKNIPSKDPDRIHRELVLEGFSREYFEDLFEAGDLECMMLSFSDALAIHFAGENQSGLYVAVDPGSFDPFPELSERCDSFVS